MFRVGIEGFGSANDSRAQYHRRPPLPQRTDFFILQDVTVTGTVESGGPCQSSSCYCRLEFRQTGSNFSKYQRGSATHSKCNRLMSRVEILEVVGLKIRQTIRGEAVWCLSTVAGVRSASTPIILMALSGHLFSMCTSGALDADRGDSFPQSGGCFHPAGLNVSRLHLTLDVNHPTSVSEYSVPAGKFRKTSSVPFWKAHCFFCSEPLAYLATCCLNGITAGLSLRAHTERAVRGA